jgi:hypothetical protein
MNSKPCAAILLILFSVAGNLSAQTGVHQPKLTERDKSRIAESLITKTIEDLRAKSAVTSLSVSTENLSSKLIPEEIMGVKIIPVSLKQIRNSDDLVYLRIKSFVPREGMVEVIFGRAWIIPSGHSGYDANYFVYRKKNGEWLGEKTDEIYYLNFWGPGKPRKPTK